jgi:hypothetical protein
VHTQPNQPKKKWRSLGRGDDGGGGGGRPQRALVAGVYVRPGVAQCRAVLASAGVQMSASGDHSVINERLESDRAKWEALQSSEPSAAAGVVADIVLIDDHDDTSRVEDTAADGTAVTLWGSHLKIGRISRTADGKYTLTSTASATFHTDKSDASALPHRAPACAPGSTRSLRAATHDSQLLHACRSWKGVRLRLGSARCRVLRVGGLQWADADVLRSDRKGIRDRGGCDQDSRRVGAGQDIMCFHDRAWGVGRSGGQGRRRGRQEQAVQNGVVRPPLATRPAPVVVETARF